MQDDATQAPTEAADYLSDQEEDVDAELEALAQEEDVDAELQALAQARQWHCWLAQLACRLNTLMQICVLCGDTSG